MMWTLTSYGNNVALVNEDGNQYSYTDVKQKVDNLATFLNERRLVFILCSNTVDSLIGYITCLNHHIVPLMLDSHINTESLLNLINIYHPDYFWLPAGLSGDLPGCTEVYRSENYSLLKTGYNKEFPLHDDLALLLTTSGSTGSPKLVRQSYENIRSNTESIVEYLGIIQDDRAITTLPMSYTYGLSILNSHLHAGASVILTEKTLMQREFWQIFKQYGATSINGVPYTYEMLDRLRFPRMDLPSLRTLTQAGGKLSVELHQKFAQYASDTNRRFFVMYGQTEATARMAYLPHEMSLNKIGSIGISIPGGSFTLLDDTGKAIRETGVSGELVYTGKNVTMGYAEIGEDLAKGDERQGVLFTDDIAWRDSDGYYFIVGRKKRFLKIFGNRVNLDEIEQIIKARFSGIDCACTGYDDKMFVFISNDDLKNDVLSCIVEKTGLNQVVFDVKYLELIPKNSAGKILYSELEAYYE